MGVARKADRVADDLLRRIVRGELAAGGLLPKEAELAEQYEVNRSVVREAIKQLEVHELVRPVKRRGTEVLDPLRSPSPEVLRAMLTPRPGVVDPEVLAELLDVRAQLDVEMTGLAAERREDKHLVEMAACLGELSATLGQPEAYSAAMHEFALCNARATHNRIYSMLVHWHRRVSVDVPVLQMMTRMANEGHLDGVRMLVELIRTRQVDPARALVKAVHDWAMPRILAMAGLASGETPTTFELE